MPKHESQPSSAASAAAGRKPPASSSGHRSKYRTPSERQTNSNASGGGTGHGGGASTSTSNASSSPSSSSSSSTLQPNLDSLDPYEILGVPRDATIKQIKLSYRKLALKHHPDRQTSDLDKEVAHKNFAAIGNAYEILEDEGRRREYDDGVLLQQQQQQQQQRQGYYDHDPFAAFHHPFMSSMFGGQGRSSRSNNFHFTDPFELFNHFFAEDDNIMGNHHHNNIHRSHHARAHAQAHSTSGRTHDPFVSSSANDPFSHPFFSNSGFGGGGLSQMMSGHFGMMNQMNSMMSQMHSGSMMGGGFSGFGQQQGSSFISSSSSSNFNHGGQQSVSTSTRTTIVNGVRQTVTERTVVHPDGRVERHVETTGGGGDNIGRLASANHPALDYGGSMRRSHR